jgi:hypothetical protein
MKYKHVASMAHNFAHSFVSAINYVNDSYIVDELASILRNRHILEVRINFLTGMVEPTLNSNLLDIAIEQYRRWLPNHAMGHRVDITKIIQLELVCVRATAPLNCTLFVQDDRGIQHQLSIQPWER